MTERQAVDLDLEVARKVMGWNLEGAPPPPPYSKSWGRAWEVVCELRRRGWLVVVKEMPDGFPFRWGESESERSHARCCVELTWMPNRTREDFRRAVILQPVAMADTMPEAVCRAALEAVKQFERWIHQCEAEIAARPLIPETE